ncbi:MAG: hypothetical protein IPK70_13005 [Flavobacteriales bacterium]|jgi:hypothetical protein|nr:hypothetical protein [Flavobacteriales bacterium]
MSKALRKKATELLGFGMPKQTVFDTMVLEHPEAKPRKIAELLRYMPTQWAREKFRLAHLTLLGIIALSAALRVLRSLMEKDIQFDQATAYLSLVPIATLLVGWSLYRWQGQVFEWVGWGNIFSGTTLLSELGALAKGEVDAWSIALSALSVGIGALSLYLARSAFAKPKEEKDPSGGPVRYLFPVEELS